MDDLFLSHADADLIHAQRGLPQPPQPESHPVPPLHVTLFCPHQHMGRAYVFISVSGIGHIWPIRQTRPYPIFVNSCIRI